VIDCVVLINNKFVGRIPTSQMSSPTVDDIVLYLQNQMGQASGARETSQFCHQTSCEKASHGGKKIKRRNGSKRRCSTVERSANEKQEEEYEVERVTDHRVDKTGNVFYSIKCFGYDNCHNMWIHEKNTHDCSLSVERYLGT